MGMESWFFTLSLEQVSDVSRIHDFFMKRCAVSPYNRMTKGFIFKRRIADERRFVIDDKAVIEVESSNRAVHITFELCFCNYEKNVEYAYSLAKALSLLGDNARLIVLRNRFDLSEVSLDKFKAILSKYHGVKMRSFVRTYGILDVDVLPGDFYRINPKRLQKRQKRKSV